MHYNLLLKMLPRPWKDKELSSSVVIMSNHIYPSDCNTYIIGSVQQPELQMDLMITAKLVSAHTCTPETVPCCYLK